MEDAEEFRHLQEQLQSESMPEWPLESLLVEQIIVAMWRLRRVYRVEAGIYTRECSDLGLAFIRDSNGANAFTKLSRYETNIEHSFYRALHELQRIQATRKKGESAAPLAVDVTVDVDPTLSSDGKWISN